MGKYVVVH